MHVPELEDIRLSTIEAEAGISLSTTARKKLIKNQGIHQVYQLVEISHPLTKDMVSCTETLP